MAATTQQGTSLMIGFGGNTYSGYVMQDFTREATGNEKVIRDVNNATQTVLTSDLGERISFKAVILASTNTLVPPARNSVIAVNSVNYRCESASVAMTAEEAVLSVTAIKEAAMTY